MFDFYTKWKLKKELEKRANRKISDSYLENQRSIYERRRNESTSTIDVMNYMLLNDLLDLSTGKKLVNLESEKPSFKENDTQSKHNDYEDNRTYSSNYSSYGGGGSSSYDSGGSSSGSSD